MDEPQSLLDEVQSFLRKTFRGSTLRDGYSHILFEAPVERRLRSGHEQDAADLLAAGPCWLLLVGADPADVLSCRRVEQTATVYNPDWNVWEPRTLHVCELNRPPDIEALMRLTDAAGAAALVSPGRSLCYHAGQRMLYAAAPDALADFEAWLEPGAF